MAGITCLWTDGLSGLNVSALRPERSDRAWIIIAMATITYDIMDNVKSPSEWWNDTEIKAERERERVKCEESSASSGS